MSSSTRHPSDNDHVGYRYIRWDLDVAPNLTAAQKARALDAFADEFASMPPHKEPTDGWGDDMAYSLRRMARTLRGEPNEEWVPRRERPRQAPNGFALPAQPVTDSNDSQMLEEIAPPAQM